jgi:predicted lysophospholipase L1 biosynthesis ABC-type transport system permease subunit
LLVSCAQLAHTPGIGRCAPGALVAAVGGNLDVDPFNVTGNRSTLASTVWPAAHISPARLAGLTVDVVVVSTSRSTAALEHARTTLELAFPDQNPPQTLSEINSNSTRSIAELQQMTNVVIAASLVIAGCSLAVSVTGGVNERKRPFSLLRLTGVPVAVLRRVVALEAAVPLVIISVLSAAMGFLAAGLFLQAQLGYALRAPGPGYYALVGAGLVASLAIIAATLPLIERITGPEVARNE